jgi:hypothetical protein
MVLNPNWPVIEYAICPAAGPSVDPTAQGFWLDVSGRTEGKVSLTRGKQYELDQVQPAEDHLTLRNDDGVFDAANGASFLAGYLIPYRLFRKRAQWSPTINKLTQNQATAGEATLLPLPVEQPWGVGGTLPAAWVYQPRTTTIVADGTAYQGANVYATPMPGTYPALAVGMRGWSVAPLTTYTVQCRARSSTASVTATVRLDIEWRNAAGTVISTVTGTATSIASGPTSAWTQIAFTATSPAGACGATAILTAATGPASVWTLQSDAWQVEANGSASAYVTPGTWYPMFTGYIERWPQSWSSGGNYGTVDLTAVDAFAFLANQDMQAAALAEILLDGPDFFYPLNDPSTAAAFYDLSGQKQAMKTVSYAGAAASQFAAGTSIQDASSMPLGHPGPAVTFTNHGAAGGGCMVLDVATATGTVGPNPANGWTRILAFRMPAGTSITTQHTLWNACASGGQSYITLQVDATTGNVSASIRQNATTFGPVAVYTGPVNTGHWIIVAISLSADGKTFSGWGSNALTPGQVTNASSMMPTFNAGSADVIGAAITPGHAGPVLGGLTADVALVAQLPYDIGTADIVAGTSFGFQYLANAFYGAFRVADSADQRYMDILAWARYLGAARISAGHTTSYGPATDLPGSKTLQALQAVVDTEAGQHFIAADGAIVFRSRVDRYNKTPTLTFGEHSGSGEIPYLDAIIDYDPTRVANDVQVTEQLNNQLFRHLDGPPNPANNPPKSQDQYGAITLSRTVNSTDPLECDGAAEYYLYQYKQPQQRLEALPIDVAANPSAAWAALLGLDLGSCVQVNRRPSNAPAISIPGFVEQIVWDLDDALNARCTLQISNSALHQFWILGETRMTLHSSVAANATSMIVNALADAATNVLASNISAVDPSAGNPEWLIDAGTASAEFVTITAVPTTVLGYTTATLTVGLCYDAATGSAGTGFRHAHSANAVIQDAGGIFANLGGATAALAAYLQPANQWDASDVVGSTTIVGY